jgi:hypothetical protein
MEKSHSLQTSAGCQNPNTTPYFRGNAGVLFQALGIALAALPLWRLCFQPLPLQFLVLVPQGNILRVISKV